MEWIYLESIIALALLTYALMSALKRKLYPWEAAIYIGAK